MFSGWDASRINKIAVKLSAWVLGLAYLAVQAMKYPSHFASFFSGFDQSKYLLAARAWAHGDLDPALHHYLPGYSLLGAPFVYLIPDNPFLVVNLICLLLSFWLFVRIATILGEGLTYAPALAALAFVLSVLSSFYAFAVWVTPLTTTAAMPFLLLALWRSLDMRVRPTVANAFIIGLAGAALTLFRPSDAAVLLVSTGLFLLWSLYCAKPALRSAAVMITAFLCGVAIPMALVAALHLLIYGTAPGEYLALSAAIGFEARLIPLRWVSLIIDPRPVFPDGYGLAEIFPWIMPGIAGALAVLATRGQPGRDKHLLVVGAIVAYWLMYLAYRDLGPQNFWKFFNYHYFKWTQPFLAFYALLWCARLRNHRVAAVVTLAAVAVGLFCWRLDFIPTASGEVVFNAERPSDVDIDQPFSSIDSAYFVQADGEWIAFAGGDSRLVIDGQVFSSDLLPQGNKLAGMDIKLFKLYGGALIIPTRLLPPGKSVLLPDPGITVPSGAKWVMGRQKIGFAPPCLLFSCGRPAFP